jgi:hypothetical protein
MANEAAGGQVGCACGLEWVTAIRRSDAADRFQPGVLREASTDRRGAGVCYAVRKKNALPRRLRVARQS